MTRLAAAREGLLRIRGLMGWRRYAVALGFGCLAALAFAPLRLWPLLIIAFSGLALLTDSLTEHDKGRKAAFFTGSAFGFGYFGISCLWLANAFLVQADTFAWMIPVVLPAFFLFLGLFFGLACWIHVALLKRLPRHGLIRIIPLLMGLTVAEWLRGHILTGLPWNLTAQAMAGSALLMQPLAVLGPYGYGFLLTFLALLPAAALLTPYAAKRAAISLAAGSLVIAAYGALRLATHPTVLRDDAAVIVIQPNMAQRDKLDPQKRRQGLRDNIEATAQAAAAFTADESVYVVWPENAYPLLDRIPDLPDVLAQDLPSDGYLITGSIREVEDGYANALLAFGPAGAGSPLHTAYDKHRLVPFGETLPFYEIFDTLGIASLSPVGGGGFIPGNGPRTIALGNAPFAPLICYEDVFPETLFPKAERPDWMVVVTNDAWFGDAAGPRQHLDIARMRAIENGLPVVRSANTGISGIIDPNGRLLQALPLYQQNRFNFYLPAKIETPFYPQLGDVTLLLLLSVSAMLVLTRGAQHGIDPGTRQQ
ncbi:MAG: apolipoprotein N-acyltransferase [Pseudomonadota bacterium]